MPNDIDIVILWVDGSDPSWIKQKNTFLDKALSDTEVQEMARQYRSWDNLQFIFRGVEKFMPWIRRVHFVTNGQKPAWLNTDHPKLNWVKHSDYMPDEYLPTYSANPIELNLHRIDGLAEHFIYFNDDMFITRPIKKSDYFSKNGLPNDQAIMLRTTSTDYTSTFDHILLNNIAIINQNFDRNKVLKNNFSKYFSLQNGIYSLLNASYLPTRHFPGFAVNHVPQPYLKSTFSDVWTREPDILHKVSLSKFRSASDVNQYLMREWQLVTGKFHPKGLRNRTRYFAKFPQELEAARIAITSGRYLMVCINDVVVSDFEAAKLHINASLNSILPDKSDFEL